MPNMASLIPSSTPSTPKRKHGELSNGGTPLPALNTTKFSFDLSAPAEDGANSPRTKVAHKFRGLAIDGDSGSGVARGADGQLPATSTNTRNSTPDNDEVMRDADDDDAIPRKRVKRPDNQPALPDGQADGPKIPAEQHTVEWAEGLRAKLDPAVARPWKTTNRSRGSSNDSKSRRRRSGTPPFSPPTKLRAAAAAATQGEAVAAVATTGSDSTAKLDNDRDSSPEADTADDDSNSNIVDPVRAALTWQEDEITVYDPDDEDDDGTGINGIGFKPTASMAYTRTLRRKQQIAEYKKREEQEARAQRRRRRRRESDVRAEAAEEEANAATTAAAAAQARRVHFMDAEPTTIITT